MTDGPKRVAILGSCVTRDPFNRTFNPGYKDHFEVVALCDKVSLVSLMAEPFDIDTVAAFPDLKPYWQDLLKQEFTRSFLTEVVELQPDLLIFDLYTEIFFGYAKWNGHVISRNHIATTTTPWYADGEVEEFRFHVDPEGYMEAWTEAADRLFPYLREQLPNTKFILHRSRATSEWVANDGTVTSFSDYQNSLNPLWEMTEQYVLDKGYVDDSFMVFEEGMRSYEEHPWGHAPVHYTMDFHSKFLEALIAMGLEGDKMKALKAEVAALQAKLDACEQLIGKSENVEFRVEEVGTEHIDTQLLADIFGYRQAASQLWVKDKK